MMSGILICVALSALFCVMQLNRQHTLKNINDLKNY